MIAFSLGNFDVYRYGLFYLLSFLIGYAFLFFVGKKINQQPDDPLQTNWAQQIDWRKQTNWNKTPFKTPLFAAYPWVKKLLGEWLDNLMLSLIAWVVIWWRLWWVLFYNFQYYLQDPGEIFSLQQWWMAFLWGALWVLIALLIIKKIYKLSWKEFLIVFDLLLLIVPVGIILGRFWNFLNQELYGIPVINALATSSLGNSLENIGILHVYPKVDTLLRRNTNFLSIFFEWIIVLLAVRSQARKNIKNWFRKPWNIVILFTLLYSISRFFLEYIRVDSQSEFIWSLTITQRWMVCIWVILGCYWIWKMNKKRTRGEI